MDTNAVKSYLNNWLEENKQEFYAVADDIWAHPELGLEIMRRFADAMSEVANVEKPAKLEGRTMLMFLAAKPAK